MGVQELVSILQFFLFLLVVVFIVLAVMFVGGLLVACVSIPSLVVLPTVRRQFVTLTEKTIGVRPDSVTSWRFVSVYLVFVYVYGFTLLLAPPMIAESGTTYGWLPVAAVLTLLVGGILRIVRPAVTKPRLRAVGEWTVFLCLLSGLVLAAAFVVPYLLFNVIRPLLG